MHIRPAKGGLPGMDFYNFKRDPGETSRKLYPGLFADAPLSNFIGSHKAMMAKFTNRDSAEGKAG